MRIYSCKVYYKQSSGSILGGELGIMIWENACCNSAVRKVGPTTVCTPSSHYCRTIICTSVFIFILVVPMPS